MIVGQGHFAFAVVAGGGCLDSFFSHLSFLSSFTPSLGDGPILTEILDQRAVKPKATNQPNQTFPHFLIKEITDENTSITSLFPFVIQKVLQSMKIPALLPFLLS